MEKVQATASAQSSKETTVGNMPKTIDEVIAQLEALIDDCIKNNDRMGIFAALYHKVTTRVKEGILNNEFENGERMENLDVVFANRYLEAAALWRTNKKPTNSWRVAFEATKRSSPLIFQHLLLGINAHINLDLGIATVESIDGANILNVRRDFNSINNILASLVFETLNEINRVSPLLSLFGLHANNGSILIQFSITNARDGAWSFAEDLSIKKGLEYDNCIKARDETIQKLGLSLLHPKGLLRFTRWIIHLFEWRKARKIIVAFYHSQKKYISFSK